MSVLLKRLTTQEAGQRIDGPAARFRIVAQCSYFGSQIKAVFSLAAVTFGVAQCVHMATLLAMAVNANANIVRFRATPEDLKILSALQERLGLKNAQVLRVALRRLHEQEFPKPKGGTRG